MTHRAVRAIAADQPLALDVDTMIVNVSQSVRITLKPDRVGLVAVVLALDEVPATIERNLKGFALQVEVGLEVGLVEHAHSAVAAGSWSAVAKLGKDIYAEE